MRLHTRTPSPSLLALSLTLALSATVWAGDSVATAPVPTAPAGILPLPDYSGDFWNRAYLLGDLGGKRSDWAKKGFTFNIDTYQYAQAVVQGGASEGSRYGGVIDWNVAIDFDRMGLIPGGLLQVQGVSRYGGSANGFSGGAIPVNTAATTPDTKVADDEVLMSIPSITYTQFLSKKVALLVGKINTYPQSNEFSGGMGQSQFWNLNLVAPVTPLLCVPYSALGGGAIILPSENTMIEMAVGTSTDVSTTTGFSKMDDGLFGLFKIAHQYEIGGLPGGIVEQCAIGFDSDFSEINGRFNLVSGQLTPTTKSTTWFNSCSIWQYLWTEDGESKKVDFNNGVQDLQGVGFFARYQFADKDTNPINYMFSVGLSAKGLIPHRDHDTMGIAFNYSGLRDTRLGSLVGLDQSTSVWEAYYNIEITPAVHCSLNAQVLDGTLPGNDTAVILGSMLQMRF